MKRSTGNPRAYQASTLRGAQIHPKGGKVMVRVYLNGRRMEKEVSLITAFKVLEAKTRTRADLVL